MPLVRRGLPGSAEAGPPAADLRSALTHGSVDERWMAARRIAGEGRDVQALDAALSSENEPRVRETIFTGLAQISSADSIAALVLRLRSDDARMRIGALDALRMIGVRIVPHLGALMQDRDPDVRILACDLAIGLPGTETTGLLCQLLEHDPEVNVCAAAVEVVAEAGTPEALPSLQRCAARFPDSPFLAYAITIAQDRIGVPVTDIDD